MEVDSGGGDNPPHLPRSPVSSTPDLLVQLATDTYTSNVQPQTASFVRGAGMLRQPEVPDEQTSNRDDHLIRARSVQTFFNRLFSMERKQSAETFYNEETNDHNLQFNQPQQGTNLQELEPKQFHDSSTLRIPLVDANLIGNEISSSNSNNNDSFTGSNIPDSSNNDPMSTWSLLVRKLFYKQVYAGSSPSLSLDQNFMSTANETTTTIATTMLLNNTTSTTITAYGALDKMESNFAIDDNFASSSIAINWPKLLLAIFFVSIMLLTAIGNLFVIFAILLERNLRTVGNYLVLSLAIADLLVACLVMPLASIYKVLDTWTLGIGLCDVWTSADVFCCTGN